MIRLHNRTLLPSHLGHVFVFVWVDSYKHGTSKYDIIKAILLKSLICLISDFHTGVQSKVSTEVVVFLMHFLYIERLEIWTVIFDLVKKQPIRTCHVFVSARSIMLLIAGHFLGFFGAIAYCYIIFLYGIWYC